MGDRPTRTPLSLERYIKFGSESAPLELRCTCTLAVEGRWETPQQCARERSHDGNHCAEDGYNWR